ncbi:MAG: SLC13 family permease [Ignavibacteria bacterium]|nr:SLC13 family permease [Ignavibacteria bacterium]MBT8383737.1 SLC13 family permease [Ignavibacteria bacterium]MBT8393059.1 SLC13 family permease [Ignavibacteria bacterium]NNJ52396.1 SLC13/DASS family transporter [Ignavibacteriaceae bacterium]NNL19869.1 SLC13/DASS family transporter [Ignavibacteriaceae bacterium]
MIKSKKYGIALSLILFTVILLMDDFDPSKPYLNVMAAISVLMAVLWITEAIPLSVTSLIPLIFYPITGILSADEIASSYINSIIFLFLGGFLIAISMEEWNLHKRIALKLITIFGGSPSSILIGFMIAGAFLSMWISNTATALMLLPIALAIISKLEDQFTEKQIQSFSLILLLSIAYSCTLGGVATLVGTPPNLVFVKTLNIMFPNAPEISFSSWMLLAIPVSIVMLLAVGYLLTKVLFKIDKKIKLDKDYIKQEYNKLGKIAFEEKAVGIVFCITALLWIFRNNIKFGIVEIPGWANLLPTSDFINDGTVAISMAFILFLIPAKNKSRAILDANAFIKVPWGIILLFGGGFALAKGFSSTGLAQYIGEQLTGLSSFPPILIIIFTAALISFLTELTSNTATTQMILPILASVSIAMQLNPLLLMLTATLSASMAFMLPVATPPNTIIFASKRLKISEMARTGFALNILGIIIVSLLVYFLGNYIFDLSTFPGWAEIN